MAGADTWKSRKTYFTDFNTVRPQHNSSARAKRENIFRILAKIEGNSELLRDILVRILKTIGRFESCWSYAEVSISV